MLGVFAGVGMRALTLDADQTVTCKAECHGTEHPTDDGPCSDSHSSDDECPTGPHHHHDGLCGHSSPMAVDFATGARLPLPDALLVGLQFSKLLTPEGPVFELDKPPLI